MDGCTHLRTNYFGVSVRFIDANNKPCTHTITVRDTKHNTQASTFINLLKIFWKSMKLKKIMYCAFS